MSIDFSLATAIVALLTLLALFAAGVQEAVELIKPYFNMYLPKDTEGNVDSNVYVALIRATRVLLSIGALFVFGGFPLLAKVFPLFAQLPEFVPGAVVVILCGFVTGLGTNVINSLLKMIAAIVLRIAPTEEPTV